MSTALVSNNSFGDSFPISRNTIDKPSFILPCNEEGGEETYEFNSCKDDGSKAKALKTRRVNYTKNVAFFIGYVLEIEDNGFTAELHDQSDLTSYEIAKFEFNDVSDSDMTLLKIGSAFYWSIGYTNDMGQCKKESFIRFKRSKRIDDDEFDAICDKAKDLNENILWQ